MNKGYIKFTSESFQVMQLKDSIQPKALKALELSRLNVAFITFQL